MHHSSSTAFFILMIHNSSFIMHHSSSLAFFIRKANYASSSQQCYMALCGKHIHIHPHLTFVILSNRVLPSPFFIRRSPFVLRPSSFIIHHHHRCSFENHITSLRRQECHMTPLVKHIHLCPSLTFGIPSNKVLHSSFIIRRSSFVVHYICTGSTRKTHAYIYPWLTFVYFPIELCSPVAC